MYAIFNRSRADGPLTRSVFVDDYLHPDDVKEFDKATNFKGLPERAGQKPVKVAAPRKKMQSKHSPRARKLSSKAPAGYRTIYKHRR